MRQKLGKKHLRPHGESADGNILSFSHISQSTGNDLIGGVKAVVVGDGIVGDRMIEKLRNNAGRCGADAILIVEHQVVTDDNIPAANPAFMTAYDYDTTEGNSKQLYADVDRNFVNTNRNRTSTTAGSSNNFTRIIRAEFIRYNSGK